MSVLIKGMKMPEDCYECGLSIYCHRNMVCKITKSNVGITVGLYERMMDCPLVEVKTPHGILIDINELEHSAPDEFGVIEWSAPTIVEAEE